MDKMESEDAKNISDGNLSCAFSEPLVLEETQDESNILAALEVDTKESQKDDTEETQLEQSQNKTPSVIEESQDLFDADVIESSQIEIETSIDDKERNSADSKSPRKRKGSESDTAKPKKLLKSDSDPIEELSTPESLKSSEADIFELMPSRKINLSSTTQNPKKPGSVEVVEKIDSLEIINLDSSENSDKTTNSNRVKESVVALEDTVPIESQPEDCTSPVASVKTTDHSDNNGRDSFPTENATDVHTSSTPNGHHSVEEKDSDSFKSENIEFNNLDKGTGLRKNAFYVEVYYTLHEQAKMVKKEISHINCEEIIELPSKRLSDISSGALADVSKNNSPNSSSSGIEKFQLPNRLSTISNASRLSTISNASRLSTLSRFSITSTSSSGSSLTAKLNEEHFRIPDIPRVRDKISPSKSLLAPQQIEELKVHWTNSEQLFKILNSIDNSTAEINIPELTFEPRTKTPEPEQSKLEIIEEVNTPKSEKRSVRKKRGLKTEELNKEPSSDTNKSTRTSARKHSEETSERPYHNSRSGRKKRSNSTNHRLFTPEPDPLPMTSNLTIKREVFARWTDKKYYSGVIEEHVKDNKWAVKFDDGNKKILIDDYIIPNCHSLLKGHSVYALDEKTGEYDSGIVTKLWVEKQKICYEIELDNLKTIEVSADQLFLTEDQASTVREEISTTMTPPVTPSRLGTVSLDNIVEGKRSTRANRKYGDSLLSSPRPGSSGTRRLTPRKLDSEDDKSFESKSECCALEEIGGVEPELRPMNTPLKANKGPGKVKGTLNRLKRLPRYKDSETDELLGPIPPDDSNIFDGLSFILVCAVTPPDITYKNEKNSASSGTETENELMDFTKIPFIEERLRTQLIGGGGVVYSHFEEIPPGDFDMCKLISNRPNRTAKYIQCVAAGVQVLNHEWVVRCCKENRRLSFQELPVGWSIEKSKFIDSYDRTSNKPLQNLLIYFAPNIDKHFLKFWERVCSLAGGTVIIMDNDDIDFQTATFILADGECSESIVDRAVGWGIPLLSTTWIVQSIIHGEYRSFEAHPKYAYDSIEYD